MSEEMKEYKLKLKNIKNIGKDYFAFYFEKPDGFLFKEGQYGVFKHIDKEIEGKKFRAFSIASSNNEEDVIIGTKIIDEPSDFKAKMLELKKGELFSFTGFMGDFVLEKESPAVFIAGGIGITPIRGILMSMNEVGYNNEATLIFAEERGVYPFNSDFESLKLQKLYSSTIPETQKLIDDAARKYGNDGYYYIAGSNSFVNGISEQIKSLGVDTSKIKFDRFSGY